MSYDITTEPDTGLDWNYTYNVQPMTARAGLPSLNTLDGVPAVVAALVIDRIIDRMASDPVTYCAMNPGNGWGDYDGFLGRLLALSEHLHGYPDATVRVG
jgi:hypothetical protein